MQLPRQLALTLHVPILVLLARTHAPCCPRCPHHAVHLLFVLVSQYHQGPPSKGVTGSALHFLKVVQDKRHLRQGTNIANSAWSILLRLEVAILWVAEMPVQLASRPLGRVGITEGETDLGGTTGRTAGTRSNAGGLLARRYATHGGMVAADLNAAWNPRTRT